MNYKSMLEKMLEQIPETIHVYSPTPLSIKSHNRYYLMMCKYLHPDTNIVCVKSGERYIPIANDEILQTYLGSLAWNTFSSFISSCLDIGLLMILTGKHKQKLYIINPTFAKHQNVNMDVINGIFKVSRNVVGLDTNKLDNKG